MDAYTTSQDENLESTPLVEPSEHGSLHRSQATKDDEHSFAMAESITTGAQQFEQEQQESSSITIITQPEDLKSSDSDIKKKDVSSLPKWDDVTNLAELKDEGPLDDNNAATNSSSSNWSSYIATDDIVINTEVEPPILTIMKG